MAKCLLWVLLINIWALSSLQAAESDNLIEHYQKWVVATRQDHDEVKTIVKHQLWHGETFYQQQDLSYMTIEELPDELIYPMSQFSVRF